MFSVYCDIKFLSSFHKKRPDKMVGDELTETEEIWRILHSWLKQNVAIYLNINENEFKKYPFVQQYLNKWAEGRIKLYFDTELFDKLKQGNPCKNWPFVIVFSDSEDDIFVENVYGLELINSNNFGRKWELFGKSKVDSVSKNGTISSLRDLSKFRHHFNSIVIVDRYLLKGKDYAENIKDLVSSLLENLEATFPFNISILTQTSSSLDIFHKKVKDKLLEKFPKQKFYLTIANISKVPSTHDRRIITNYAYFFSGDSFSGYDSKDIDTQLHYDPLGETRNFALVEETLKKFRKLLDGTKNVKNQVRIIQEEQNYLLNN